MRDKRFSFCASAAFLCRFRPPPPPKCNFSSLTDFPQPQRLRKSAPKSFPPLIIFVKRPVVVQLQQQQQKIFRNFLSKGYGCVPRPPWPPRAGPTSRYLAPHVKTCVQKPHARACNLKSVRFARGWWSTLGLRCYVLYLTSFVITCIESNYYRLYMVFK